MKFTVVSPFLVKSGLNLQGKMYYWVMAFSLYVIFFTACLLVTAAAGSLNLMCIAYLHLHTRQSKYGCKKQHYFAVLLVSRGPPTDSWRLARLSDAGC